VQISLEPFKIGKALLENGQFDEAIAVLEPVVKEHSKDINAHYALASAYLHSGKLEAAMQELERCKALLPDFQEDVREDCESQGEVCLDEMVPMSLSAREQPLAEFIESITRRYEAEDLQKTTGEVFEQSEASAGKIVEYTAPQHLPGYLVHGQNAEYAPGHYQARFRMRILPREDNQSPAIGTGVFFEVYDNHLGIFAQESVLIENTQEEPVEGFKDYTVNFDLTHSATLQFRVKATGQAQVAVDKIDVYPRLPLQIYRLFAQGKARRELYDETLHYVQEVLSVDPWTLKYQQDLLQTLIKIEKWTDVLQLLTSHQSLSEMHTGIASGLFEREDIANTQFRQFLKELSSRFSPPKPLNYTFADTITLQGYDVSPATLSAGDQFSIHYFWKLLQSTNEDYAIFVHFIKKDRPLFFETRTRIKRLLRFPVTDMFQQDHHPLHGAYPTNRWIPGELIREEYDVGVPQHLEPGIYEIWIGVWNPLTEKRLQSNGKTKVKIGEIKIEKRDG
jgi:tetratricopeptide (TPR) repeat protein